MLTAVKKILSVILYRIKYRKECNIRGISSVIRTSFEGHNYISRGCSISDCEFGFGSYTGRNTNLHNVSVGRYTCIGPNVSTITGTHPSSTFVSVHPAFYDVNPEINLSYVTRNKFSEYKFIDEAAGIKVSIGSDVWIGAEVKILDGVSIGNGAIIAAGAIVTKDVKAYSIVGGIPARLIKYRFSDEQIRFLKAFQWWNKDTEWIRQHAEEYEDIEVFIKKEAVQQ